MASKVYIRPFFDDVAAIDMVSNVSVECLITDSQDNTGKVKVGSFSELKADMFAAELVLIIPAEQVLLLSVNLPGKNIAKLKQALPYSLEDQIINDIDEQYFVLGPKLATHYDAKKNEQYYAVAVTERDYLENILDKLKDIGIHPDKVLPESLLLPFYEGKITVVEDGPRFIVRFGMHGGFSCDKANLEMMLSKVVDENEEETTNIIFHGAHNNTLNELQNVMVEQREAPHHLISLLYNDSDDLNLLPGQYIYREKFDKRFRRWVPAAAMLIVWVIFQLSMYFYDYNQLKKQDIALQKSLETIYRQTFPDAKKIPKGQVKVLMEQRLNALRKRSGQMESGFTEMLVRSAPILKQAPKLKLQALRYHNGQMDLELEISDLNSLEQLKEKLIKIGGWKVEIQSASATEGKVQGKLQVRSTKL